MTSENDPIEKSAPGELLLTRVFHAPRALVFKAWTDPMQLAQWWGPSGFTNPRCELDVRPGGRIHVDMQSPNGTIYPMFGAYREIAEPERIVFTAGALDSEGNRLFEILNTVTFEEHEGRTTLTLHTHVIQTTGDAGQYLSGHAKGWAQSLERFADFVQCLHETDAASVIIERTFDAPVETVWKAISEKDQIKHWFFDLEEFNAAPGAAFQFDVEHNGVNYLHRCKVTEVIPGRKLAYSWRYEGHEGDSLVTFQLYPEGSKTRLRLTHEGLNTFPKSPGFARGNFEKGWTMITEDLANYLSGASPGDQK